MTEISRKELENKIRVIHDRCDTCGLSYTCIISFEVNRIAGRFDYEDMKTFISLYGDRCA